MKAMGGKIHSPHSDNLVDSIGVFQRYNNFTTKSFVCVTTTASEGSQMEIFFSRASFHNSYTYPYSYSLIHKISVWLCRSSETLGSSIGFKINLSWREWCLDAQHELCIGAEEAKKSQQQRVQMSQFLWITHRLHCEQFSLDLRSSREIVPMKALHSQVFGLLRKMVTLFLGRDVAHWSYKHCFNAPKTTNEIPSPFIFTGGGQHYDLIDGDHEA